MPNLEMIDCHVKSHMREPSWKFIALRPKILHVQASMPLAIQKPMQCVGILTLCGDRGVVALNLGFLGRW